MFIETIVCINEEVLVLFLIAVRDNRMWDRLANAWGIMRPALGTSR